MVTRGRWGREGWELVSNGDRVSVLRDEKVLEMDGGNGCLMPLNCTLKNSYYGKFYTMYNLPQLKKNYNAL